VFKFDRSNNKFKGQQMTQAKDYFKTLFEDDADRAMFFYRHHTREVARGDVIQAESGLSTVAEGLGRLEVYDKAPGEEGAMLNSNPMAIDDARLLPAIVEHYFYNPRHRKAGHPHYYWLHWFVRGKEIASLKVELASDGRFPIVAYDPTRKLLVKGTPSEVWAKVPAIRPPST
jgi:hypothetical protein